MHASANTQPDLQTRLMNDLTFYDVGHQPAETGDFHMIRDVWPDRRFRRFVRTAQSAHLSAVRFICIRFPLTMVKPKKLRSKHLTAQIEYEEAPDGSLPPECFVRIRFDDETLTMCEHCVPELLDLLTRIKRSIDKQKEKFVS